MRSGAAAILDGLAECVSGESAEEALDLRQPGETISAWLNTVPPDTRRVFLRRYWHCNTVREIAAGCGFTQGKVKSLLHRARKGLRNYLAEEGYSL